MQPQSCHNILNKPLVLIKVSFSHLASDSCFNYGNKIIIIHLPFFFVRWAPWWCTSSIWRWASEVLFLSGESLLPGWTMTEWRSTSPLSAFDWCCTSSSSSSLERGMFLSLHPSSRWRKPPSSNWRWGWLPVGCPPSRYSPRWWGSSSVVWRRPLSRWWGPSSRWWKRPHWWGPSSVWWRRSSSWWRGPSVVQ